MHSLWEFPVLTLKYGGVVFILVYLTMFLILGSPMLLLEMTLGQYGGMAPTKLYRNICPVSNIYIHIYLTIVHIIFQRYHKCNINISSGYIFSIAIEYFICVLFVQLLCGLWFRLYLISLQSKLSFL